MSAQEETIEKPAALTLADPLAFMKLPIEERRRILAEQAEQMVEHYEEESARRERELWQGVTLSSPGLIALTLQESSRR